MASLGVTGSRSTGLEPTPSLGPSEDAICVQQGVEFDCVHPQCVWGRGSQATPTLGRVGAYREGPKQEGPPFILNNTAQSH